MNSAFLLLSMVISAGVDVRAEPLEGEATSGELLSLTAEEVSIAGPAEKVSLPTKELQTLQFTKSLASQESANLRIELLDGSELRAASFQSNAGQSQVDLGGAGKVTIASRSLRSVRFHPPAPELQKQWDEIVTSKPAGDLLIIRKTTTRIVEEEGKEARQVTETALDQIEGTLLEVNGTGILFDFDGDKIEVKLAKIEGILFYQSTKRQLPAGICRVMDSSRSNWVVKSILLEGDEATLSTPAGVSHQLPLSSLLQIDFVAGNVMYLAEMDLEQNQTKDPFQPAGMKVTFSDLLGPAKNKTFAGDGLTLQGGKYDRGLGLHSGTRLDVRIPEGFRRFRAMVGIDDAAGPTAGFRMRILADGKEVASHAFAAANAAAPLPLDLDLSGIKRLSILVEDTDGRPFGDLLNMANARVTK